MKRPGVATRSEEERPAAVTADQGASAETEAMSTTKSSQKGLSDASNDNHRTGKYGIPTATMNRARRHLGDNPVAQLDLQDRLFDAPITERALGQRDPIPDDPVGVYYDARTGRLVDVGENKHGWLVSRDHETHEPDVFDPGRVRPAINDRRLLPVSASVTEVQG